MQSTYFYVLARAKVLFPLWYPPKVISIQGNGTSVRAFKRAQLRLSAMAFVPTATVKLIPIRNIMAHYLYCLIKKRNMAGVSCTPDTHRATLSSRPPLSLFGSWSVFTIVPLGLQIVHFQARQRIVPANTAQSLRETGLHGLLIVVSL